MRALNISDSGLAGVTGFGILQEIFKETYQRPLIVNKRHRQRRNHGFVGAYPLGLPGFHGSEFAAVGGV